VYCVVFAGVNLQCRPGPRRVHTEHIKECNVRGQTCDQERSGKYFKNERPYNRNAVYVECKKTVIPVTTGATGTVSKSFSRYVNNTLVRHDVKELETAATLGTR
jgi:hypothetical protein